MGGRDGSMGSMTSNSYDDNQWIMSAVITSTLQVC